MISLETWNNNEKICHFLTLVSKAQPQLGRLGGNQNARTLVPFYISLTKRVSWGWGGEGYRWLAHQLHLV